MKKKLIIFSIFSLFLLNSLAVFALDLGSNPKIYRQKIVEEVKKVNHRLNLLTKDVGMPIDLTTTEEAMRFFVVNMDLYKFKNNTLVVCTEQNRVKMTDITYKFKCIEGVCNILIDVDGGFGPNKISQSAYEVYDQVVVTLSKDENGNLLIKNPSWIKDYIY
jgi:hypothetical protein